MEAGPHNLGRRDGLTPGQVIGAYVLVRELGRGGMGVVWLARDERLNRMVAIKTLHVGHGAGLGGKGAAQDQARAKLRERALGEARALAAIEHPNIASVFDIVEREGTVFVVMEYVPGESLGDRIRRGGLRVSEAVSIALQVAEALAAAHAKGLLHRDLKPSNIQLTSEGVAKVLDFGLSSSSNRVRREAVPGVGGEDGGHVDGQTAEWVVTSEDATGEGDATHAKRSVSGTPAYMSPEQQLGEELDARSDMYAFGCVLYEMLTGQIAQRVLPTGGRGVHVEPVWDISKVEGHAEGTTDTVRMLLAGCLRVPKHERMRSAADAAVILRGVLEGSRGVRSKFDKPFSFQNVLRSRAGLFVLSAMAACAITWFGVIPWIVAPMEGAHAWYAKHAKMPTTPGREQAKSEIAVIGFKAGEDAMKVASILGIAGVQSEPVESWRRVHAAMIERIAKARPRCITLDFAFPAAKNPENTKALVEAIARVKDAGIPVVVGVYSWKRDEFGVPTLFDPQLLESGARRGGVIVDSDERSHQWKVELGLCRDGITQGNTGLALETYLAAMNPTANTTLMLKGNEVWIDFWRTKDGVSASERATAAKRMPIDASIVYRVDSKLLSSESMLREKGYEVDDVVAEIAAPFDRAECSTEGLASYADVAKMGSEEMSRRFKGKFVVVGDLVGDVIPAPDGGEVCGVFSHVAGLSVLLSEVWIQELTGIGIMIWVLFSCVVGVACMFFAPKRWQGILLACTIGLTGGVCCLWLPRIMGVWLNPLPLVVALAVGTAVGAVMVVRVAHRKGIKS